jgi:hypothetical protein
MGSDLLSTVGEETYVTSGPVTSQPTCGNDSLDIMMPSVGTLDVQPDDDRCDVMDDRCLETSRMISMMSFTKVVVREVWIEHLAKYIVSPGMKEKR